MEFFLTGFIFLILLLLVIWRPFFKQHKHKVVDNSKLRHETNVGLYKEHKAEIEKDYQEGGIDDENYQYLLAELDNTLLQDISDDDPNESDERTSEQVKENSTKQFSPMWPLALSLFIIVFSVLLYQKQGRFVQLTQMPEGHGQKAKAQQGQQIQDKQSQAIAYINEIKAHVEKNPQDTEAWYNLGQTYVAVGAFDAAITSFKKVIEIEGEQADLIGALAQAVYYKNNQKITPEVQQYIDQALALDVNDPATNILLGMHNFIEENYQQAISFWQRVIDTNNQGVNIAALKEAVAEAKQRANMPVSAPEVSGPQLAVNVSLSDEIFAQLSQGEDRIVFVYAVPTNGQRMPLAAVKIKASNLPTTVVLNNSQAMSSANNLASVDKVHIYAVASKLGGVGIKPGDFKAQALSVDVNSQQAIELVINSLVE